MTEKAIRRSRSRLVGQRRPTSLLRTISSPSSVYQTTACQGAPSGSIVRSSRTGAVEERPDVVGERDERAGSAVEGFGHAARWYASERDRAPVTPTSGDAVPDLVDEDAVEIDRLASTVGTPAGPLVEPPAADVALDDPQDQGSEAPLAEVIDGGGEQLAPSPRDQASGAR